MSAVDPTVPSVPEGYERTRPSGTVALPALYASAGARAAASAAGGAASAASRKVLPALRNSPVGRVLPASLRSSGPQKVSGALELPRVVHVVDGLRAQPEWHERFCRVVHASPHPLAPGSVETAVFSGALHALAFPVAMSVLTRRDFPLPVLGMVHLGNTVHHLADVAVGEALTATAWTEGLRAHRSGTALDAVVTLAREDGTVAWAGRSTYLAKGVHAAVAGDEPRAGESSEAERPAFEAPQPTGQWSLGAGTGREYAAVSGDYNPIHLSDPSARALGMKGAIAHGMYTASRALALTGVPAGVPFAWSVEFAAPVRLPATVAVAVDDDGRGAHWSASRVQLWDPGRDRPHADLRVTAL
ncbi:MaoC/PaaZ C-terminal domain-containing protein [Kocuria sp.]|uniref:MaoC/PaaZ C-terminal domain-containing protein n=1 Tax=Kocuria sp. TaxID=1871328 RepID=UPI0026DB15A3|nr:MaoC/PaaZ C-terminal domain-containing protein [Kocuria sp.]MDO4920005.1 MaoC/PaaZ C-terminal domain-containing protein [Kocuria sp.]